jgi:hypothetical protein
MQNGGSPRAKRFPGPITLCEGRFADLQIPSAAGVPGVGGQIIAPPMVLTVGG